MFCIRAIITIVLLISLLACVPAGQSVQEKKAQQADVHYKLGMSFLKGKDATMALKELLIAVENDPEDAAIQAALAQAYQSKRAYSHAERHYNKALTLSDNEPLYQNNLASLYLEMKKWDKAIDLFEQASSNLLFSSAHISLAGKGYAYFMKKDYPAALTAYGQAIRIAPRYPMPYFRQSEVYEAMGNEEQMGLALEKTIDVSPGFVPAIYKLGILALKEQRFDDATGRFERVIELAPGSELGLKSSEMLRSLPQDNDSNNDKS